ncbi:MAG TPA: transporter substrate-binding domain-containing protein [Oleiagrimonas sp.]|nr:transporter substrate-binding domain-containing protein [Oleiagrimonas sp.]
MGRFNPLIFLACLLFAGGAIAQTSASSAAPAPASSSAATGKTLTVGVKVAPPFVIADGKQYRGIAIDLWQDIAKAHGWTYQYKRYDLDGLLDAVRTGQVDVGLGALTTTAQREQVMDFSHPITSSGLGVAVHNHGGSGWLAVAHALMSPAFLKVIGTLVLLLLIVGVLVWAAEHKKNPEQFGGSKAEGIFSGFWWAMVTMTTVGYGDTAPRSVPGRILGLIWMLTALLVVSFFTASITSALTVGKLSSQITSASDLHNIRVASVAGSTSGDWLDHRHDRFTDAKSLPAALAKLNAGKVDAVVYDAPLLRWQIHKNYAGNLRVLPFTLARQDYAIALPSGSKLREPLDTGLLKRINSSSWKTFLDGYLGSPD